MDSENQTQPQIQLTPAMKHGLFSFETSFFDPLSEPPKIFSMQQCVECINYIDNFCLSLKELPIFNCYKLVDGYTGHLKFTNYYVSISRNEIYPSKLDCYLALIYKLNFKLNGKTGYIRPRDLTICGDIESNPGPDMKELARIKFNNNKVANKIENFKNNFKFNKPVSKPLNIKVNRRKFREVIIKANIQGVSDYFKNFKSQNILGDAVVGSIPFVGTPLVASKHINQISDKVKNSLDSINGIISKINDFFTPLTSLYKESADWITSLRRLFVSFVNISFARPERKIASFILNLTNFCVDCGLSFSHFDELFNRNNVQAQIQIDIPSMFAQSQVMASGLVVILFSLMYKITGQVLDVNKAISFLGKLGKDLSGIKTLSKLLSETSNSVMSWFKGEVLAEVDTTSLEQVIANISIWFRSVRECLNRIDDKSNSDRVLEDVDTILHIEDLYKQGLEFSIEISNKRLSEQVRFPFEQHMKLLTEVFKKAETSGAFGNKPRISPIVIWIYGESGVGKSGATWPLAIDMNNELLKESSETERRNFSKHVYFRNVEQEFWDGYANQNVVCYDDFGQMKDSVGVPNLEFFEIIRTGNIAPYPLHMAHLEEKRKTKFTSKVVFLSSNKEKLNNISMTYPEAVDRRVDVKARVLILPEFQKMEFSPESNTMVARLDSDKVIKQFGVPISTHVYAFQLVNPFTNVPTGELLNYKQFSDKCTAILRKRVFNSRDLNKYLEDYAIGQHKDRDLEYKNVTVELCKTVNDVIRMPELNVNANIFVPGKIQMDLVEFPLSSEEEEFYDVPESIIKTDVSTASLKTLHSTSWLPFNPILLENRLIKISVEDLVDGLELFDKAGKNITHEMELMYTYNSREEFFLYLNCKYDNVYTKHRKFNEILENGATNFKTKALEFLNKSVEFVKNHPMAIAIGIIGSAISIFAIIGGWNWLFSEDEKKDRTVAECVKYENGLKIVTGEPDIVIPVYNKNIIDNIPKDTVIGLENISISEFCKLKLDPSNADRTFVLKNGLKLRADNESAVVPPSDFVFPPKTNVMTVYNTACGDDCQCGKCGAKIVSKSLNNKIEAVVSGDNITRKPLINKVESIVSGDNITRKPLINKIESYHDANGDMAIFAALARQAEANVSGDSVTRAQKIYKVESTDAEIQMWKDTTAQTLISNKILANLYRIIGVKDGVCEQELLNCLFVRGRIALVPNHVRSALSMYDRIYLINSFQVKYEVPIKDLVFVPIISRFGEKEAGLMYVDSKYIHNHSDIVKHFQDSYTMGNFHAADISVPCLRFVQKLDCFLPVILGNTDCKAIDTPITIEDVTKPASLSKIFVREGLKYKLNTKSGDCGSPIICNETSILRKIAGIHVAGSADGSAYAESVSRNDLERALQYVPAEHQIILDIDLYGKLRNNRIDSTNDIIDYISDSVPALKFNPGVVCSNPPADATKTELRPSAIFEKVTPATTKPAFLHSIKINGEIVNVKTKNLAKAAMDTPFISKSEVEQASLPVKRKLLANRRDELCKVLTFEQAITGDREISPYFEPINRSSSPGYPWIMQRCKGSKGKQQWLGDDEYLFDSKLRLECEDRIRLAKLGFRKPTIWVDTLKDERRPIAKVDSGKTRVFANGPMDFTIVFRQYFLGFMAHVMEQRINNEQSIGTNTWGRDWSRTARHLQMKGNKVIAGDFSTFDGTLNSCIVGDFVKVINEFYNDGPENALIREVLFCEVYNSVHLCEDMIYMWTHSQPSGCPITTILNSFYNSVSMRVVFNRLARKFSPNFINKFDIECSMVSYGDDNVINISDNIPWFNQNSITDGYATIGMIYTDEGKTGVQTPDYRTIDQVAYLKRNFIFNDKRGVWDAPLELSVIEEMCNWVRGDLNKKYSTLENVSNALRELSNHDEQTYECLKNKLNEACLTYCGEYPEQLTYDGYWEERFLEYFV